MFIKFSYDKLPSVNEGIDHNLMICSSWNVFNKILMFNKEQTSYVHYKSIEGCNIFLSDSSSEWIFPTECILFHHRPRHRHLYNSRNSLSAVIEKQSRSDVAFTTKMKNSRKRNMIFKFHSYVFYLFGKLYLKKKKINIGMYSVTITEFRISTPS